MENRRNYYRILHVQFDAPEAVIRASYRTLMHKLRMHPDLGGDHWNATVINEAYAVLIDPARRAAYDKEFLAEHGKSGPEKNASAESERKSEAHSDPATSAASGAAEDAATEKTQHSGAAKAAGGACPFCKYINVPGALDCSQCRSPLTPAPQVSSTVDARRRIERIPVHELAMFYDHWPQKDPHKGEVRDFSPKGCQVISMRATPRGRRIKIDTHLFSAIGSVQQSRAHASGAGTIYALAIKFETLRFVRPEGSFVSVDA
ncbi:MAG: DnaJ domain-containing protein [Gammaproteobacteria bacterium]|nr:DnaJ domain-containing protein [Gammaproteobacteria bacterium]